jgi:hypothetical protein
MKVNSSFDIDANQSSEFKNIDVSSEFKDNNIFGGIKALFPIVMSKLIEATKETILK